MGCKRGEKEREKRSSFDSRFEFVLNEISDKILAKSIATEQILKDEQYFK